MNDYQLGTTGSILRLADGALIPPDLANHDFLTYQQWLSEGNTPEPAPEPPKPAEPTPAEKLAAAGLSIDELKTLLGL
jgi:hypothetical protein